MLRSMYAGISGMKNFQTKLDVIGNNIANVNTSGFKKGRVTFQDMMSQMTSGAQAPTATRGGVNPIQVGLGAQLGSIDNIHTQGFRQTTNNPLDFALEGDGMFIVRDGDSTYYTRAGNFYLDEQGNIVNPQGYYLQGFQSDTTTISFNNTAYEFHLNPEDGSFSIVGGTSPVDAEDTDGDGVFEASIDGFTVTYNSPNIIVTDPSGAEVLNQPFLGSQEMGPINIPDSAQSFSVQTNGIVNYVDEFGNTQVAGQIAIAKFSNPAGLEKAGSNLFLNSTNAGLGGYFAPEVDGTASIVAGALEMSNVDLSEEFTEMITAQRAFQANTRIITTSDEILQELVNLKR